MLKTLKQHKGKQIFTVVNKSESEKIKEDKQFYQISLNKLYFISAEHGIGIGDLLDDLIKIKPSQIKESEKPYPFCIIGRTNVGKSTLLNSIVGEERSIASPIPHTTRDMIDTPFTYHNEKYLIIDTAGIRRRGKIQDSIERYAIVRTEHAISKSSLILLTIDCSQEFNEQDEVIGGLAFKANLPTIICVNK
ncbi:hypothetical protein FACS189459_5590 [Bacilli bacterium]|nr:hypothetical protein FACS189459_5590 [Bacilli bacterium]